MPTWIILTLFCRFSGQFYSFYDKRTEHYYAFLQSSLPQDFQSIKNMNHQQAIVNWWRISSTTRWGRFYIYRGHPGPPHLRKNLPVGGHHKPTTASWKKNKYLLNICLWNKILLLLLALSISKKEKAKEEKQKQKSVKSPCWIFAAAMYTLHHKAVD